MRIHFFSNVYLEDWDWRASLERGIGGSETSQVEMAWRLARRGHEVISYGPIPTDCPKTWRGTTWEHFTAADFSSPGLWILYRCPQVAATHFKHPHPDQQLWLVLQDWDYPWTPEALQRIDRFVVLSQAHATWLSSRHPELAALQARLLVSNNGVKVDLIHDLEEAGLPPRLPHRLMYASSPDRGLRPLLSIYERAKEWVSDLELHVFYGFDNIDVLMRKYPEWRARRAEKTSLLREMTRLGVQWHGRVPQPQLYREWMASALWVYPTTFAETACVTGQEAQALGAIPITNAAWAQGEHSRHGIQIAGSPETDSLVRARYVSAVVRLATDLALQDRMRGAMMPEARRRCDWERAVDQWDTELQREAITVSTRCERIAACRLCGGNQLATVLDLGCQVPAGLFFEAVLPDAAPLDLVRCVGCGFVQLRHTLDRAECFGRYGYRSGVNATMREHLTGLARQAARRARLKPDDLAIDIGANDGTLLAGLPHGRRLGFEPSEIQPPPEIPCMQAWFSAERARAFGATPAKLVTSVAMFYSVHDPIALAHDVAAILAPNGLWVIELAYLGAIYEQVAFDQICHEHLGYYRLRDVATAIAPAGLGIEDVQENPINGGSIRVFCRRQPTPTRRVAAFLAEEESRTGSLALRRFVQRVADATRALRLMLDQCRANGQIIWGYGASTKGNVLLQFCGITADDLVAIADRNPAKHGRFTPGTGIPIRSEEAMRAAKPDGLLVLPWAFLPEFLEREAELLATGTRFLVPLPVPRWVP